MHSNLTGQAAQITISLAERSYPILIGKQLMADAATYAKLPQAACALIVSNTTVAPLYARELTQALAAHYKKVLLVTLPDGEAHKDWPTLQIGRASCRERVCAIV